MASDTVNDALFWLRQQIPIADRVYSLVKRCAEGNLNKPEVRMSTDLYVQMYEAACKALHKQPNKEAPPKTMQVALGQTKAVIVHDTELPIGSMHAHKAQEQSK